MPARAARATRSALAFLTVIPLGWAGEDLTDSDLADSRFAYPVVGAMIGLLLGAISEGLRRSAAPAPLSAFLLVAAGVVLTGGLHLDGLADTFDGLFLRGDPERRLAVMRDPHLGSFGVAAMVLVLLGRYSVLATMTGAGPGRAFAVLGAAAVSRTLILVSAGSASYARREGTGRILIDSTSRRDALLGAVAVLAIATAAAGRPGLIAGLATLFLAYGLTRIAKDRLGGVTGDTLGALVELGELTFLVTVGLS